MQKKVLQQHWVHSHEEDTGTEMVFRPATFPFPRSRGRNAFDLKQGGKFIDIGIAPTDGNQSSEGTWELDDNNHLILFSDLQSKSKRALQIVSVDKDRLIVKK